MNLEKAVHREGRQGREGKQRTSLVIKITNLVIAIFTLVLISLASLAVQMLGLDPASECASIQTTCAESRTPSARARVCDDLGLNSCIGEPAYLRSTQ
jgi:hypothetical protein